MVNRSSQAKQQRRGQPGNPGQFAPHPSTQAEAAPAHSVNLEAGVVAAVPGVPGPPLGSLLPGGEVTTDVRNALDDWNWDGPSRRIEENLRGRATDDVAYRLACSEYVSALGVAKHQMKEGVVYWDVENVMAKPKADWKDPDHHISKFKPLQVSVSFSTYDPSEECLMIQRWATAETNGEECWRWTEEDVPEEPIPLGI